MDIERRLIDLESKVAHQDQALLDMSEEIYRQQQQIALLEDRCRHLQERLEIAGGADQAADPANEIPPHY